MLQAIIDIGSNTLRMVVYRIADGRAEQIMKKKHLVGLAAFLKNGVMQQEGIERVCEVLGEYNRFLQSFHIDRVAAFTTAALRNAKNSREAVDEIIRRTGIDLRVISGDEEAEYDFIGATHTLPDKDGLLVDIGGASTEIVCYTDGKINTQTSLLIGSLSLHSQFGSGILPTGDEIATMQQEAAEIIGSTEGLFDIRHAHICGIGGTFKGGCALYNKFFGREKKNCIIEAVRLQELIDCYRADRDISEPQLISLLEACADRLHTIIPGLIIADAIARRFGSSQITYSDSGVREGYIYKELLR